MRERKRDATGYLILADYCDEKGWEFQAQVYRLAARIVSQPRVRLVWIMAQYLGLDLIPDHELFRYAWPMYRSGSPIRDAESLAWLIRDWFRETQNRNFP